MPQTVIQQFYAYKKTLKNNNASLSTSSATVLDLYHFIIREEANDDRDRLIKGKIYFILKRYQEAIDTLSQIGRSFKLYARAVSIHLLALVKLGKYKAALALPEVVSAAKRDISRIHYAIGLAYAGQNKWQESILAYQTAIEKGYIKEKIYYHLGKAYYRHKNYEKAREAFFYLVTTYPQYFLGHYGYAYSYVREGLDRGEDIDLAFELRKIKREELLDEAIKLLQRVNQAYPRRKKIYNTIGDIERKLKKYDEALKTYQAIMHFEPENIRALSKMACCFMHLGNIQAAFELIENIFKMTQVRTHKNKLAMALDIKGSILFRLEKHQDSLDCYNQAMSVCPNKLKLYLHKGKRLLAMGDYGQAILSFDKAVELDSGNYKAKEKLHAAIVESTLSDSQIKQLRREALLSDLGLLIHHDPSLQTGTDYPNKVEKIDFTADERTYIHKRILHSASIKKKLKTDVSLKIIEGKEYFFVAGMLTMRDFRLYLSHEIAKEKFNNRNFFFRIFTSVPFTAARETKEQCQCSIS